MILEWGWTYVLIHSILQLTMPAQGYLPLGEPMQLTHL